MKLLYFIALLIFTMATQSCSSPSRSIASETCKTPKSSSWTGKQLNQQNPSICNGY